MDHVLPHLIAAARAERDRRSVQMRQAQQAVQQARSTLERLHQFRQDYFARSAAATGAATHRQALEQYQRFVHRLEEAVAVQHQELALRQANAGVQQDLLIKCQQRLLAFETLVARRANERERREQKAQQRQTDEFAARSFRRGAEDQER